jgi:hypothetical protein
MLLNLLKTPHFFWRYMQLSKPIVGHESMHHHRHVRKTDRQQMRRVEKRQPGEIAIVAKSETHDEQPSAQRIAFTKYFNLFKVKQQYLNAASKHCD